MRTIFDLHTSVLADYRDFVRSFLLTADERALQAGAFPRVVGTSARTNV